MPGSWLWNCECLSFTTQPTLIHQRSLQTFRILLHLQISDENLWCKRYATPAFSPFFRHILIALTALQAEAGSNETPGPTRPLEMVARRHLATITTIYKARSKLWLWCVFPDVLARPLSFSNKIANLGFQRITCHFWYKQQQAASSEQQQAAFQKQQLLLLKGSSQTREYAIYRPNVQ